MTSPPWDEPLTERSLEAKRDAELHRLWLDINRGPQPYPWKEPAEAAGEGGRQRMDDPIGLSEADRARALKDRARKLLIEMCALMDEAQRDGLAIRWANIAMNSWGRHEVVDLHVIKRF